MCSSYLYNHPFSIYLVGSQSLLLKDLDIVWTVMEHSPPEVGPTTKQESLLDLRVGWGGGLDRVP